VPTCGVGWSRRCVCVMSSLLPCVHRTGSRMAWQACCCMNGGGRALASVFRRRGSGGLEGWRAREREKLGETGEGSAAAVCSYYYYCYGWRKGRRRLHFALTRGPTAAPYSAGLPDEASWHGIQCHPLALSVHTCLPSPLNTLAPGIIPQLQLQIYTLIFNYSKG
jgi:hypothetical protein